MGLKRIGSTKYASRSNSMDKFRRQLSKIDGNFRINHQSKPNIRTKSKRNLETWVHLGLFESSEKK